MCSLDRVLVFGRTGQLARCLADSVPSGANATFLDRAQADFSGEPDFDALLRTHSPRTVIVAAAYTAVEKAEDEREIADQVNGRNLARLGRACQQNDVRIVHFSTDYVFDGTQAKCLTEEDPVSALGAYGRSKLAGEVGLLGTGAQAHVFRTSWVFSSYGHNFLRTMLRVGQNRTEVRVVADQFGNPSSAHDLAKTVWSALPHLNRVPTGIYHLTGRCHTDEKVSWHQFATTIFQLARENGLLGPVETVPIGSAEYPTKVPRPADTRLDCAKFEAAFELEMPHWSEGTRDVIERLAAETGRA